MHAIKQQPGLIQHKNNPPIAPAQSLKHAAPPVYRPAAVQQAKAPPVYRPSGVQQAKLAAPPVYRPTTVQRATPAPPSVYRPQAIQGEKRAFAGPPRMAMFTSSLVQPSRKGRKGGNAAPDYQTKGPAKKEKFKIQARQKIGQGPGHFSGSTTDGISNATKTHNEKVNELAEKLEAAEEKAAYDEERRQNMEEKQEAIERREQRQEALSSKVLNEMAAWLYQSARHWINELDQWHKTRLEEEEYRFINQKRSKAFDKGQLDQVVDHIIK